MACRILERGGFQQSCFTGSYNNSGIPATMVFRMLTFKWPFGPSTSRDLWTPNLWNPGAAVRRLSPGEPSGKRVRGKRVGQHAQHMGDVQRVGRLMEGGGWADSVLRGPMKGCTKEGPSEKHMAPSASRKL